VDRIAVIGEVLWDIFPDSRRLGGAPLNFAVNARRLGHEPLLVSAVGNDKLGEEAVARIAALGLDTQMVGVSNRRETGTARVEFGESEHPKFTIVRPAAYDDVQLRARKAGRRCCGFWRRFPGRAASTTSTCARATTRLRWWPNC